MHRSALTSRSILTTALLLLLSATLSSRYGYAQADVWTGVERIVAVGDVHGGYGRFVQLLRAAKVVDKKTDWIGGSTHLVQLGDVVDKGLRRSDLHGSWRVRRVPHQRRSQET